MRRIIVSQLVIVLIATCSLSLIPQNCDRGFITRRVPQFFAHELPKELRNTGLEQAIFEAAATYNLEPALVAAIIQVESGFNPFARSRTGAMGLMQLMPATARMLGVHSPFDPVQNIFGGARYLRKLLNRFKGNMILAIAAYNAGPGAVMRYGRTIPPYSETRKYVPKVVHYYKKFAQVIDG